MEVTAVGIERVGQDLELVHFALLGVGLTRQQQIFIQKLLAVPPALDIPGELLYQGEIARVLAVALIVCGILEETDSGLCKQNVLDHIEQN